MAQQVTTMENFLAEKEIAEITPEIAEVQEHQGAGVAAETLMMMVIYLVEIAVLEIAAAAAAGGAGILKAQEMIG